MSIMILLLRIIRIILKILLLKLTLLIKLTLLNLNINTLVSSINDVVAFKFFIVRYCLLLSCSIILFKIVRKFATETVLIY